MANKSWSPTPILELALRLERLNAILQKEQLEKQLEHCRASLLVLTERFKENEQLANSEAQRHTTSGTDNGDRDR